MFTGRFPIETIFVRLLEAYLALMILDPAERGVTPGGVLLVILVVAIIEAAFRAVRQRVRRAVAGGRLYRAEDFPRILADALKRAEAEVTVFTYALPPSAVRRTLGLVRGISDTEATTRRDFRLAEQEALLLMLKEAHDLGANAVVGVRLTTGTYEAGGSQWQVSRPVYTGTAVRI